MALPTPVNGQITDAVTQSNVKVLGDGPALAMGAIYQSLAHSTGRHPMSSAMLHKADRQASC